MSGKHFLDWVSIGTVVGTIMGWLPQIAALFSMVWLAIQIYESKTFKRFMTYLKGKP